MATLAPTEEKADCFRLQLFIVDIGTFVLRHKFDHIVHPQPLKDFLRSARGKLDELFKKKVISNEQWKLLYPHFKEPDSETFDISLISCLLLNVCGLTIQSHPAGWIPSSMDKSIEADISRIRKMRNDVSGLIYSLIHVCDWLHIVIVVIFTSKENLETLCIIFAIHLNIHSVLHHVFYFSDCTLKRHVYQ